jgi:hypothetical protein
MDTFSYIFKNSTTLNWGIEKYYKPFKFDNGGVTTPTKFAIEYEYGNYEYKYFFTYDKTRIYDEKLEEKSKTNIRNT